MNTHSFLKSFTPHAFRRAVTSVVTVSFFFSSLFSVSYAAESSLGPSWSKWKLIEPKGFKSSDVVDDSSETLGFPRPAALGEASGPYRPPSADDPIATALTIDDMMAGLSQSVGESVMNRRQIAEGLPGDMMQEADRMTASVGTMYADIKSMFSGIDQMRAQVRSNYEAFNAKQMTANDLNAQSDQMAERAAWMRQSLAAMRQHAQADQSIIQGMVSTLEAIASDGKDAAGAQETFARYIKTTADRLETLFSNLQASGWPADPASVSGARRYINALQAYANGSKSYVSTASGYAQEVQRYLQNAVGYFDRVLKDFDSLDTSLQNAEAYFRAARIKTSTTPSDIFKTPPDSGDVCSSAETKGLKGLDECQKSCHSVCRWKEKVSEQDCYECPSGSPESCFDVGAWPSNHPWCQPGGICHDDPMLYCSPFGAISPVNHEHLDCTVCKQRQDMCWQNVGQDTTSYSVCKQNCWNGKCVFKGKYKEKEWDGTDETIHCFECKTPPPPPSCDDLGWGYDWKSDCEKNCPDPGFCEEQTMPPGAKPKGGQPNPNGGRPGGQCGGGLCGGVVGGDNAGAAGDGGRIATGVGNGGTPPSDGGNPPNPPRGTPQQPSGSGGGMAGGEQTPSGPSTNPPEDSGSPEPAEPPQDPGSTTTHQPQQPKTGDKPNPPPQPPQPPTNPDIEFYKKWRDQTRERIKSREDIINDPNEGDSVKDEARRQLKDMTDEEDYLDDRIEDEEDKERARQQEAADAQKRQDDWERTRPRTPDYAKEMRDKEREWKLKKLKEANDALQEKLKEAKDALTGRRDRIDRINHEIDQLETEISNIKEARSQSRVNRDYAEALTSEREKRIKELKDLRNVLVKKLAETQKKLTEELTALKDEYARRLWSVDENARRKAETQRIDEYAEHLDELHRREQAREIRGQTFDGMVKSLEGALADAKAKGDSGRTDDLQRQIDNMKRGQTEWDATQQRQIDALKEQIRDLELRNGYEGVGPSSPESLGKKLHEYQGLLQGKISDAQNAIDALEKLDGSRTPAQEDQLNQLKAQVNGMNAAVDGLNAKKQDLSSGSALTFEERQRVTDSATRVAAGAMNTDADKSFLRLAGESLVEEMANNANPLVAAKKSIAFGWGMAKGVGKAVGGLVELGAEAVDTVGEAVAVDLGYEDGGIFGTDNLDAINGAISTVGSNMNFDGVLKAVVAAGGAIDAEITRLEHSKDVDWDTAELGGDVVGQTVAGDMVIAGALGKAGKALGWVDEAAEGVNAANKGLEAVEDAARAGSRADDVSAAQRAGSTVEHAPASAPTETAPTRGPPPVDRGAPTVRDTNLAGSADEAVTGADHFNPPPDETPTKVGLRPGEDDIKTAVGGLKSETPTIRHEPFDVDPLKQSTTDLGGVNPPVDETPTKIGGMGQAVDETEAATKVGLENAAADEAITKAAGVKPVPDNVIGANKNLGFVDDAGRQVDVQTGDFIKSGSTSSVYVNGANKDQIIRITTIGGDVAEAKRLDEIGRGVVETIQKTDDRVRIATKFEGYTVSDPASPLNNKVVEVVERAHQGDAKAVLQAQGGVMTKGQAEAFDQATRAFNEKGYAWLDNHTGNYTFEHIDGGGPDDWRVVILDPGGIAPMKGATLAEKAENARAIQQAVNVPTDEFKQGMEMFKNARPDLRDLPIAEQYQNIMAAHGQNIDVAAMGLKDAQQVQFNAGGLLKHPQVSELFGRSAEEAAAALRK